MDIDPFEIPPDVTGFGVDPLPHEVEARRQSFVSWVRALDGLNVGAREQADSYKPQTIGNLIFNFWT